MADFNEIYQAAQGARQDNLVSTQANYVMATETTRQNMQNQANSRMYLMITVVIIVAMLAFVIYKKKK